MARCKITYDEMLDLICDLKIMFELHKDDESQLRKDFIFVLRDYLEVDA